MATKLKSLADDIGEPFAHERAMLIAFYKRESPWMVQTLEDLRLGYPFTADNLRVLAALKEAFAVAA